MEKWTSSPFGTSDHLEPEVLASFLDGHLSENENKQVRRHLAQCEDCHQVFVSTVDFLREEEQREAVGQDNVRPFGRPAAPRHREAWGRRLAVAATVVLAVGAGVTGYWMLEGTSPSGAGLRVAWQMDSVRSGESRMLPHQRALKLGVMTKALEAAVHQGQNPTELVQRIAAMLGREPSLKKFPIDPTDPEAADQLLSYDFHGALVEPGWFDLGQWATVGKAATEAGREDYLRGSWRGFQFGRTLSRLQREKADPRSPWPHHQLSTIEHLLEARKLDFPKLDKVFSEILASR